MASWLRNSPWGSAHPMANKYYNRAKHEETPMKMKTIARLMPLLAIGLVSGQASAAGFQLLEQNASGIGTAVVKIKPKEPKPAPAPQ